ncbi:MAG TPA: hypothetical protein VFQ88_07510 [Nevskiaceae bacterium]|nr:hypothetical protein [Nevskiaceae bacterium]
MTDGEYATIDRAEEWEELALPFKASGWLPLARAGIVPKAHMNLIASLQSAHDQGDMPVVMRDGFRTVAERYGLSTKLLDALTA